MKPRRTRSDCTVGTFEKKNGLPAGTIRNRDGRDTAVQTIQEHKKKRADRLLYLEMSFVV